MPKKRKIRSSETTQIPPEPEHIKSEREPEPEPKPEPEPEPKPEPEPESEPVEIKQGGAKEMEADPAAEEEVEEEVEEVEEVEEEEDEEEEEQEEILIKTSETDTKQFNGGGAEEQQNNNKDEDLEDEPFEKLLEPFSNDQMVVLLKEAVSKHPDLMASVRKLADADPAHRKIFVHGLGWDTTAETLTSVFGKFGEIEDCKAVTDKVSGKSKGYGFILYKHRSGARKALVEPQKKIGNRMTSCQLASTGPVPVPPPTAPPPVSEYTQRKIFVSNVAAELDPQKLLEFFSKFGEIEDGPLGLDKQTGKPKGFCLFVYKNVEGARKALEEPHKNFEGHTLHCQKAIDGPKPNKQFPQQQQQQQQQQQLYGGGQHLQQQYYGGGHPSKKGKYSSSSGGAGSAGHLMAPSAGPPVGFSPAVAAAAPALNPALGQALTALLATQSAGLGIGNLLGGLGAPVNPGMPPVLNNAGYGGQGAGGYGTPPGMQGGYQNPQMGTQGVRPQQGGASYMGHGH